MARPNWFTKWLSRQDDSDARRRPAFQPILECLEDRLAPSITPAHLYTFNNGLADAMGGPTLVADGGTVSAGRYVFGVDQGLRLNGGLADTSTYSVALSLSQASVSRFFTKLLDFQSRASDNGLYLDNGHLQLYPGSAGGDSVTANQDFQVVLSRDGASGVTSIYLNGVLQQAYTGSVSNVAIPGGNVLTFFEDDLTTGGLEAVGGSADYIATYDQALSATDVANLGDPQASILPTVAASQPAVTASENQAASNAGVWTNAVSLSASAGTVTQNNNGTWSWTGTGDDDSPYTVTITATNFEGSTATTSFTVSFTDVAPTVSADLASVSVAQGATASNTGTFGDYDDAVTLSASVGTVAQHSDGTWSWSFATNASTPSQTVVITATNSDGNSSSTSFTLVVNRPQATVAANNALVTANEGHTARNSGTWSDPGGNNVAITASVGTVTVNADGTWSWRFAAIDGPAQSQTVTITLTDNAGVHASTTFGLVVNNVAPVITALFSSSPQPRFGSHDGYVAILGAFTDAGVLDTHTVTVNWGDGSAVQTLTLVDQVHDLFAGIHRYTRTGVFTVTVTVTDNDGGSTTRTTIAAVAGVGCEDYDFAALASVKNGGDDHGSRFARGHTKHSSGGENATAIWLAKQWDDMRQQSQR